MPDKTVIGWVEYISFPDWEIEGVKAKVDTGARTSALHVDNLEELPDGRVRFEVVYSHRAPFRKKEVTAKVVKWSKVRSSTGVYTRRCFVSAKVNIGGVSKRIEVSLVSREKMLFRMLLGRKALEKDFLVDVSKRTAITKRPKRKVKKRKTKK